MTLAAARLESDLRVFLTLNRVEVGATETLGGLLQKLTANGLLSENGRDILRTLKRQRNYLTHSLYDLFAARIGQATIGGRIATKGDDLVTVEIDGELQSLTVGGGIHAEGRGSDAIHMRGNEPDLSGIEVTAAGGRAIVRREQ